MSKKEKVAFISDSFMDKNGIKHSFVIAGVSMPVEKPCFCIEFGVEDKEVKEHCGEECAKLLPNPDSKFFGLPVTKVLSIGYAFCNANDEFNLEIGKKIAEGRAKKYLDKVVMVSDSGIINTSVVNAILSQESDFVKANPQLFIKGFKD